MHFFKNGIWFDFEIFLLDEQLVRKMLESSTSQQPPLFSIFSH